MASLKQKYFTKGKSPANIRGRENVGQLEEIVEEEDPVPVQRGLIFDNLFAETEPFSLPRSNSVSRSALGDNLLT